MRYLVFSAVLMTAACRSVQLMTRCWGFYSEGPAMAPLLLAISEADDWVLLDEVVVVAALRLLAAADD